MEEIKDNTELSIINIDERFNPPAMLGRME